MKYIAKVFIITVLENLTNCAYFKESIGNISPDLMLSAIREVGVKKPILVDEWNIVSRAQKHAFLKFLSMNGQQSHFQRNLSSRIQTPTVIFQDQPTLMINSSDILANVLIITKVANVRDLENVTLQIDDEVYFLDWYSGNVYEAYSINSKNVINHLGNIKNCQKYGPKISESFERRRGNLHGIQLKAITGEYPPFIVISKENNLPDSKPHDITDIVSGNYIEILKYLEKTLNFSTRIYHQKDNIWGFPYKSQNGSVTFTGMLKSLVDHSSDFAWTPFGMVIERVPYIDYLPGTYTDNAVIYLPKHGVSELVDWYVYFGPFSPMLWVGIFAVFTSAAICQAFIKKFHFKNLVNTVGLVITIFFIDFKSVFRLFLNFLVHFGQRPNQHLVELLLSLLWTIYHLTVI